MPCAPHLHSPPYALLPLRPCLPVSSCCLPPPTATSLLPRPLCSRISPPIYLLVPFFPVVAASRVLFCCFPSPASCSPLRLALVSVPSHPLLAVIALGLRPVSILHPLLQTAVPCPRPLAAVVFLVRVPRSRRTLPRPQFPVLFASTLPCRRSLPRICPRCRGPCSSTSRWSLPCCRRLWRAGAPPTRSCCVVHPDRFLPVVAGVCHGIFRGIVLSVPSLDVLCSMRSLSPRVSPLLFRPRCQLPSRPCFPRTGLPLPPHSSASLPCAPSGVVCSCPLPSCPAVVLALPRSAYAPVLPPLRCLLLVTVRALSLHRAAILHPCSWACGKFLQARASLAMCPSLPSPPLVPLAPRLLPPRPRPCLPMLPAFPPLSPGLATLFLH